MQWVLQVCPQGVLGLDHDQDSNAEGIVDDATDARDSDTCSYLKYPGNFPKGFACLNDLLLVIKIPGLFKPTKDKVMNPFIFSNIFFEKPFGFMRKTTRKKHE